MTKRRIVGLVLWATIMIPLWFLYEYGVLPSRMRETAGPTGQKAATPRDAVTRYIDNQIEIELLDNAAEQFHLPKEKERCRRESADLRIVQKVAYDRMSAEEKAEVDKRLAIRRANLEKEAAIDREIEELRKQLPTAADPEGIRRRMAELDLKGARLFFRQTPDPDR